MDLISRLLAVASAALLFIGFETGDSWRQPATDTTTTVAAGVTSFPPAATTFEVASPPAVNVGVTIPVATTALCGGWWGLAIESGWEADELETLDYVMWKESRCDPSVHNTTLNADGSTDIGLTQINDRSWCLPTKWYPMGYLQTIGLLSTVGCEQLFDPAINLKAAKAIHDYSEEANGNGFKPWRL